MRRSPPPPPPAPPPGEWLTTIEVAALLRVHHKHVYRLLHQGMPSRRVGGQWRFSREDIVQWASRRGEVCSSPLPAVESTPAAPQPTLVALAPDELSHAVAAELGALASSRTAVIHVAPRRAVDLLASAEVAAAVIRREDAGAAACATVRIALGSRRLGVLKRVNGADPAARVIAVPSGFRETNPDIDAWLEAATSGGAEARGTDSEPEACGQVLRGEACCAIGSAVWGRRLGLAFEPLGQQEWELAVRVDCMEDPAVATLCTVVQGEGLRSRLAGLVEGPADSVGQMRLERGGKPGPSRDIAPGDSTAASDGATRSRETVRWTLLTRENADQMLGLVEGLRTRGLRVGGFVQVPSGPASIKPLGYDLYRLSRPERLPLAERVVHDTPLPTAERACELTFHTAALERACEWLREDVGESDLIIVDGVGRLEQRGQGLFPALAWARMQARPRLIILSSRRDHIPDIAQRLSLPGRLVSELSLGEAGAGTAAVVDHVVHTCGRVRNSRKRASQPG